MLKERILMNRNAFEGKEDGVEGLWQEQSSCSRVRE